MRSSCQCPPLGLAVGHLRCVDRLPSEACRDEIIGPDGGICRPQTRGLLRRRLVEVTGVIHIGKEANELELVLAGLVGSEEEVTVRYERDPWEWLQPIVAEMPVRWIDLPPKN